MVTAWKTESLLAKLYAYIKMVVSEGSDENGKLAW